MVLVLTAENSLENEVQKINSLFENGLQRLHLRKPGYDIEQYRSLLSKIETSYYNRIMLHQFHELVPEFELRGAHLQEQPRYDLGKDLSDFVTDFNKQGYKVSSSYHSKEAIAENGDLFEYVLLSPVFGSISKKGYKGKGFNVTDLPTHTIIGMGGINPERIKQTYNLGFKGIGILGSVWNAPNYLSAFLACQKEAAVAV